MAPVSVVTTGGMIAMTAAGGGGARPRLDAAALVASVPALAGMDLDARTLSSDPSVQLSAASALRIAHAATQEADGTAGSRA